MSRKSKTILLYYSIQTCRGLFLYRSSRAEVFSKKGVPKNYAKFTGKNLCQSLFFNKVSGLRPATLLKKRLWQWCFPMKFCEFSKNTEHLRWLLLSITSNF